MQPDIVAAHNNATHTPEGIKPKVDVLARRTDQYPGQKYARIIAGDGPAGLQITKVAFYGAAAAVTLGSLLFRDKRGTTLAHRFADKIVSDINGKIPGAEEIVKSSASHKVVSSILGAGELAFLTGAAAFSAGYVTEIGHGLVTGDKSQLSLPKSDSNLDRLTRAVAGDNVKPIQMMRVGLMNIANILSLSAFTMVEENGLMSKLGKTVLNKTNIKPNRYLESVAGIATFSAASYAAATLLGVAADKTYAAVIGGKDRKRS